MKTTGVSSQSTSDTSKIQKPEQKKGQKEFKSVFDQKTSEKGAMSAVRGEKVTRVDKHPERDIAEEKGAKQGLLGEKKDVKHSLIAEKKDLKQAEKKEFKQFMSERKDLKKGFQIDDKSEGGPKEKKGVKDEKDLTVPTPILMGPSVVQSKIAAEKMSESRSVLNIKEIESIVDRVQVGVNEKGLPEFNFELNSQNLGPISLKITHDKDGIKIQFAMQNTDAQKTLQNNIGDLTRALQDRGMNLASADFTTKPGPATQSNTDTGSEGGSDQGGGDSGGAMRRRVQRKKKDDDDDYTI